MNKKIVRSSYNFPARCMQVNTRLLWTILFLLPITFTSSAHLLDNSCSNPDPLVSENTCPPIIIFIEPIADICINSTTGPETLLVTIQGGDGSGVGVWSGPGLVPPNYFDPTLANLNENIITYTFIENGFVFIETTTINVYFSPSASFSATSQICSDEPSIIAAAPVNGSTYDWDFNGGNVSSGSEAGPYEISWTEEGIYPVTLTVTDINGCTSTFSRTVTVTAPLDPPVISCNTDTSMIEFSWNEVDGALGYTVSASVAQGIQIGNTYTVSALDNFDAVTIELTVLGAPPCGDLLLTQTCYATDCNNILVSLVKIPDLCLTDGMAPIALEANVVNNTNGTGTWSGSGIIDSINGIFDPNDPSVILGTNIITYIFIEQDCSFTATMDINVSQAPDIRLATSGDLNCNSEIVELDATGSDTGQDIIIEWSGPAGGFSGPTDNFLSNAILPGTYTLVLLDTLTGCINDTSFLIRQINDGPTAIVNIPDDLDCYHAEVEINGMNSTSIGTLDFEWLYNADLISQSPITNVAQEGTYTLIVTDSTNKCSDTTFVEVFENSHAISGADFNIKDPSCHGENDAAISIEEVVGGTAPFEFVLDSVSYDNVNFIAGLGSGEYTLMVTDQGNCSWDTTFIINDPPSLDLDLGNEITLQLGENAIISAQFNLPDSLIHSLVWSPADILACVDTSSNICTDVSAYPFTNMTVSATLTDNNGCSTREEILLEVNKDHLVFIPNIFTPNGDTQNDVFTIFANKGVEKINRFFVYDRWGEIMYESYDFLPNDPTFGWDGKLKGKPLNPAVFIYWAEVKLLDGQSVVYSGDVTLLR